MGPGAERPVLPELLGENAAIAALRVQVERLLKLVAARRGPPTLIQGETGSGKGLLARQLREAGRAGGPFVAVKLRGHSRIAARGRALRVRARPLHGRPSDQGGLFQAPHQGTLFLDEVGLLPESLQVKLLNRIDVAPDGQRPCSAGNSCLTSLEGCAPTWGITRYARQHQSPGTGKSASTEPGRLQRGTGILTEGQQGLSARVSKRPNTSGLRSSSDCESKNLAVASGLRRAP